eukprot:2643569-Rhodomonas_salina.1
MPRSVPKPRSVPSPFWNSSSRSAPSAQISIVTSVHFSAQCPDQYPAPNSVAIVTWGRGESGSRARLQRTCSSRPSILPRSIAILEASCRCEIFESSSAISYAYGPVLLSAISYAHSPVLRSAISYAHPAAGRRAVRYLLRTRRRTAVSPAVLPAAIFYAHPAGA